MKQVPALLIDERSGEVFSQTYQPWFLPEGYYLAATPSQIMFLTANIDLFEDGAITADQAKLCESAFALNSWTWADRPERNAPTTQQMLLGSLLLDDDEDEEEDE